jgi:crotonobetainyl-CoA:carnitine CoA-transferase CaiB-like acyl-CoA transferase
VIAIQAALAARNVTGVGTCIDMALFDTQVAVLANQSMNFLASGITPQRMGNAHPNLVPYQVFRVADGELVIAVGSDQQFARLTEVLGIPSLAADPRARTNAERVAHRDHVVAQLQARCLQWERGTLSDALIQVGVPVGPINSVAEVFADPQVLARGMVMQARGSDGSAVPTVRLPVRMPGLPDAPRAAPRLGEHQHETWAT